MEYVEIDGDLLFVYYYLVWYFNKILYYNIGLQFYIVIDVIRIYLEIFEFVVCFRVEFVGCDLVGKWDGLFIGYQLFRL